MRRAREGVGEDWVALRKRGDGGGGGGRGRNEGKGKESCRRAAAQGGGGEGSHQCIVGGDVLPVTLLCVEAISPSMSSWNTLRLLSEQDNARRFGSWGLHEMDVTEWETRARIFARDTLPEELL